MTLPPDVLAIRASYLARFPIPSGNPGEYLDEEARRWSCHFAEQVAFAIPNQGWCVKRAAITRPISKDTIARQYVGRLLAWDLLSGVGTGSPTLVENPDSQDITGQYPEVRPEYFAPQDHLSANPPTLPPLPPLDPAWGAQVDQHLVEILTQVRALADQLATLTSVPTALDLLAGVVSDEDRQLGELATQHARGLTGKLLGFSITLKPPA